MEATLSLNHLLSPNSSMVSQATKYSTSTNPPSLTSFSLPRRASLFSGVHLGVTRVQMHPPKPQHDLVLKCLSAYGEIDNYDSDKEKMPIKRRVERSLSTRSLSLAPLRSGKVVVEGISDAKRALLDPKLLDNVEEEFAEIMKEENINWDKLQRAIWKMEMAGKEDTAVRVLKERYNKEMKEENDNEAYELGLLLVEMMIYQGHYRPARTICLSLLRERPEDARPYLYLAVTNALLGAKKDAERNWKEFTSIQSSRRGAASTWAKGGSKEDESNLTFAQFAEHMETLEREIALG